MADSADDVVRYTDSKGRKVARHTSLSADLARMVGTNGKGGRQRAQAIDDEVTRQSAGDDLDTIHARQHSDTNNDY